jgi:hypothetical protein
MALLVLSLFFLSLSAGLSTDDASKAVPQEELDLSLRSDTCTYQYALLAKDETGVAGVHFSTFRLLTLDDQRC